MTGYIKIHRKILESAEWKALTSDGVVVMMILLLGCNYHESEVLIDGDKRKIEAGQWLTSASRIREISENKLSRQNIRSALAVLEKTNFVTTEVTKGNKTIITVNNWFYYQGNDSLTKEVTNGQPTANQRVTTSKERKKGRSKEKALKETTMPDEKESGGVLSTRIIDFYYSEFKRIMGVEAELLSGSEVVATRSIIKKAESRDRKNLENFIRDLITHYLELGEPTSLKAMLSSAWVNRYKAFLSGNSKKAADEPTYREFQ